MKTIGFCTVHRRYEFCMQKYPNKCIYIEFADKAQFPPILSRAIALRFSQFSGMEWNGMEYRILA